MNKHFLSLEFPETSNSAILRIEDISTYSDLLKVTCGTLSISVPGKEKSVEIKVYPYFRLGLSACNLKLQKDDCSDYQADLPDGIYDIAYSVSPNNKVYVQYLHLRMTNILNAYHKCLCSLIDCDLTKEQRDKMKLLNEQYQILRVAKYKVEDCNDEQTGYTMFKSAVNEINKICSNNGCSSCSSC